MIAKPHNAACNAGARNAFQRSVNRTGVPVRGEYPRGPSRDMAKGCRRSRESAKAQRMPVRCAHAPSS